MNRISPCIRFSGWPVGRKNSVAAADLRRLGLAGVLPALSLPAQGPGICMRVHARSIAGTSTVGPLRCAQDPDAPAAMLDHCEDVYLRAIEQVAVKKSSARIPCGLRSQDPPRAVPARRRADSGILEDLPRRRQCHDDADPGELAVDLWVSIIHLCWSGSWTRFSARTGECPVHRSPKPRFPSTAAGHDAASPWPRMDLSWTCRRPAVNLAPGSCSRREVK
jgi:hypothetical protein